MDGSLHLALKTVGFLKGSQLSPWLTGGWPVEFPASGGAKGEEDGSGTSRGSPRAYGV